MRKTHINAVRSGDKLARPIFSENGNVLLGVGMELSERYIERLKDAGVDIVYIEDANTEGIIPEDVIRDETRRKAVESINRTVKGLMNQPNARGRAAVPELGRTFRGVFGEILQDLIGKKDVMVNLTDIHVADAYLFNHTVNVAVLAGIIGLAKGYNRSQIEELGMGALLFDLGMTKVPKELIVKTTPLTPEERTVVEAHAMDGFNMLRQQHDISLVSAHCSLQHHERFDGSGYPRGLKMDDIHPYAQIVSIADVYDALTSPRAYRNRYTPNEAIEFLFASGNAAFDIDLVKLFCRHISIYPIATTVVLNTGQVGVVALNNPLAIHRPTIRIIREADGTPPASAYDVNLADELHLMIVKEL